MGLRTSCPPYAYAVVYLRPAESDRDGDLDGVESDVHVRFLGKFDGGGRNGNGGLSFNLPTNANNHITTAPFAYDAAGNLTADAAGTYTWNAEGELHASPAG